MISKQKLTVILSMKKYWIQQYWKILLKNSTTKYPLLSPKLMKKALMKPVALFSRSGNWNFYPKWVSNNLQYLFGNVCSVHTISFHMDSQMWILLSIYWSQSFAQVIDRKILTKIFVKWNILKGFQSYYTNFVITINLWSNYECIVLKYWSHCLFLFFSAYLLFICLLLFKLFVSAIQCI